MSLDLMPSANSTSPLSGRVLVFSRGRARPDRPQAGQRRPDRKPARRFGKTFLGLTIGCARCHDHKFDAISDEDYYSLAAYMQGSTRQEYPLISIESGKRPSGRLPNPVESSWMNCDRMLLSVKCFQAEPLSQICR